MKRNEELPKTFYEQNREKFIAQMDDFSALLLFAGEAPHKTGDDAYTFTPNRNFLYMTGIDKEKIVFLAVKASGKVCETLFIERHDKKKAKWVGKSLDASCARDMSGIKDVRFLDELSDALSEAVILSNIENIYLDLENRSTVQTPAIKFYSEFSKTRPGINLKDGGKILRKMRGIKNDLEIEQIKEAINITGIAVEHIINSMTPGMYEYQVESCFDFALKYHGVKERAFVSIIGGGANATVLHYNDNSDVLNDGDMVLCDFGAAWNYYSADITRTFPVNGKFTDRQKELYNIVLNGQQKVIAAVKPGITIFELNDVLIEHYKSALKGAGLIGKRAKDSALNGLVEKYYWHKVGHSLGLDTHDCAPARDVPLEPGMVITVEPGLYVEKEGIGIRIEDDILITENGCVNLSAQIPKTVEEIEKLFAEAASGNEG